MFLIAHIQHEKTECGRKHQRPVLMNASHDSYEVWSAQVQAAFAPYHRHSSSPSSAGSGTSSLLSHSDPRSTTMNSVALSSSSAIREDPPALMHNEDLTCFYAQMLAGLYQHRSVSNPGTPRERSVENAIGLGSLVPPGGVGTAKPPSQEEVSAALKHRLERHARAMLAEKEREHLQRELRSGIVEHQNRQLAEEMTEMLQYARAYNKASAGLRKQWEEARRVREELALMNQENMK